jgi:hypothetical protein
VTDVSDYAVRVGKRLRAVRLLPDCPEGDADLARFAAAAATRRVSEITSGVLTERLAS